MMRRNSKHNSIVKAHWDLVRVESAKSTSLKVDIMDRISESDPDNNHQNDVHKQTWENIFILIGF